MIISSLVSPILINFFATVFTLHNAALICYAENMKKIAPTITHLNYSVMLEVLL